jgi:hypothetical protein
MSIIRVQKTEKFTVISNVHINDDRLSWKATSILTYLLSKPNDWTVYVKQLAKAKKDGIKAVYSGIRELKEFGYIEHKFIHGEDGKIQHGEYIVHEEPIDIETPVNRGPEPYAQKGDTVKGNADNVTLLNTDVKINTDDDKTEPPEDQTEPVEQEPKKDPSSSFSESQLITLLARLMALIPEQYQKPSVEKTIERGLKSHSEDYIRLAILYTVLHSSGGTWQKFKAYLGKCIDNGWQSGWEPERAQGDNVDKEATRERFRRMSDRDLKLLAGNGDGNVWAIEELERRESL